MDIEELNLYRAQLDQLNEALLEVPEGPQREELIILRDSIKELCSLVDDTNEPSSSNGSVEDEFALFMAEMKKEGALLSIEDENKSKPSSEELKCVEGKKCKAPHTHQWGDSAYHNAMVCSIVSGGDEDEVKVRVLFTNPTHQEMLPCPYYYKSDCKFSEDKCRFSHGEVVPYSSLREYVEPNFEDLCKGSSVLAKQSNDLWYRAIIRHMYDNKCLVRFECDKKDVEVLLEHVFPLDSDGACLSSDDENDIHPEENHEDVINMSLLIAPSDEALGGWEKYTKGMGSKLMQKMGYIVGTGLGKNAEGRIDPITAVILPTGKSLDHCMKLREQAGGDKNLFSVERKLRRLQKKQEKQNQKAYDREHEKDKNTFKFLNDALSKGGQQSSSNTRLEERQQIKQQCSRNLNIMSLRLGDNIKKVEKDLQKIHDCLRRHPDVNSKTHLNLKDKLEGTKDQLRMFQSQAQMIKSEQNLRHDKKKITVF